MKKTMLSLAAFLAVAIVSFAQSQPRVGQPVSGAKGVTQTVEALTETSRQLELAAKPKKLRRELKPQLNKRPNQSALRKSSTATGIEPNTVQGLQATQPIHSNFLGTNLSEGGAYPPDCMGDVGPSQIVVAANTRLKVYNKNTVCGTAQVTTAGALLASPVFSVDLDAFFFSVAGADGISDPHVRYDRLSQRWYIVAIDLRTSPNRCVIAVSSGPVIVNSSSFTFFFFAADGGSPVPASYVGCFFDYPTLGVDANALYIGGVMFNGAGTAYLGASLFVVRKSSLLGAGPIVFTAFHNAGTASTGIYVPQGVHNDNPAATQGYFVGVDAALFSRLNIHRVSSPGGTPVLSAVVPVTVGTTSSPVNPVSSGTATAYDAIDDRLFAAMIKTKKTDGTTSLWTAHNIAVTASGVGATAGATRRTGSRWYQLSNLDATPAVTQFGTLFDTATVTPPKAYWMPGIAASGQGHAVMGFSTTATNKFIDCGIVGRYNSDGSGTLQAPNIATTTTAIYNPGNDRFGDYSQTVVDPDDDMTMWSFVEYCNSTNSWGVRAIQAKAPAPPAITSVAGTILPCNPVAITINGTANVSEKFFDPGADAGGPGFAKRLAVSCTGGITVSNVVLVSGTQITCNLNTAAAAPGNYTLTVTNPDCQSVSTTITVAPNNNLAGVAGGSRACATLAINPAGDVFRTTACDLIARVVPSGGAAVSGSFNACVAVDASVSAFNGQPYVQRHFELEPAANAANATATVTLYFTQQEFNNYNLARGTYPALPTGSGDAAGIANLKVVQFHGRGTDPNNYTEWTGSGPAMVTIDPADAQVIYNATSLRWEVTFNATGFSGFYVMGYTPFNANAALCPGSNLSLPSPLTGATYQWQVSIGGGSFTNLANVAPYSGVTAATLILINPATSLYGNQYRCVVDAVNSSSYVLKFRSWWLGSNSTAWTNPSNWGCGGLPDGNTDVYVNSGKTFSPEVATSVSIRSLTVNPATAVTVKQPGGVINVLK